MPEHHLDDQTLAKIVTIENFDLSEDDPTTEHDIRAVFEEYTGGKLPGVQFWASTKGSRYAFLTFTDSKFAEKALELDCAKGRPNGRDFRFKWSRRLRVFKPVPTSLRKYMGLPPPPPPPRIQHSLQQSPNRTPLELTRNGDSISSISTISEPPRHQFPPERPLRPLTPPTGPRSLLERVSDSFSPFERHNNMTMLDDFDGYDMLRTRGSIPNDARDVPPSKPEPEWSPKLRSSPESNRSSEPFGAGANRRSSGRWPPLPEAIPPRQPLLRRNQLLEEKVAEAWREIKILRTERLKQAGLIASLQSTIRDLEKQLEMTEEARRDKSNSLAQARSIADIEQQKRLSAEAALREVQESRHAMARKLEEIGIRHADEVDKIQREADDSRRSILRRMEAMEWGHKLELDKVRKRERQRADETIAVHEREQGTRSPINDGYSLKRPRTSSFNEDWHKETERELARCKEYAKTMEVELERSRAWRRELSEELRDEVAKRRILEQRNKVLEAVPELVDSAFKLDEVMREVLIRESTDSHG